MKLLRSILEFVAKHPALIARAFGRLASRMPGRRSGCPSPGTSGEGRVNVGVAPEVPGERKPGGQTEPHHLNQESIGEDNPNGFDGFDVIRMFRDEFTSNGRAI